MNIEIYYKMKDQIVEIMRSISSPIGEKNLAKKLNIFVESALVLICTKRLYFVIIKCFNYY